MVQTVVLASVLLVTAVLAENNARLTTFGTNNKNTGTSNNNNNNSHAAHPGVEIVSGALVGGNDHSAKLTTFGGSQKSNDEPKNNTKKPVQGKVCRTDAECTITQNTSCMYDHRDGKHRCLCLDRAPVNNGGCNIKYRGLLVECSSSTECLENGECVPGNMTTSDRDVPMMNVVGLVNKTVCWCMEGFEHDDEFKKCNNGAAPATAATLLFVINWVLLCLQRSKV